MVEYLLDVRPILDEIGASVHVSDSFELEELVVGDETFRLTAPAPFDVTVSNAGEGLVPIGTVRAAVTATCSRCLCEFSTVISGDIEGFWPRPGREDHNVDDISGHVDAEGRIDLGPSLLAALVVEAPFAPLHDEECAGLCPGCGVDLNTGECLCETDAAVDHPFAALKSLLPPDESEPDASTK